MNPKYKPLVEAFESLATTIENSTAEKRSAFEMSGNQWNFPAVDRLDLASMVRHVGQLAQNRAPNADDGDENEEEANLVGSMVNRLKLLETHSVPYLFNGNGSTGIPVLVSGLEAMAARIKQMWPERESLEPGTLPFRIARQARTAKARLDEISANLGDLQDRIELILEAHQAAEALPEDLADLREARESVQRIRDGARDNANEIEKALKASQGSATQAHAAQEAAEGYATRSSEAYRFTTSHGLAAAFDARSQAIGRSTWVWVFFLLLALVGVAALGQSRVAALTTLIGMSEPQWGAVALNIVLSVLSVGAPLWFAWVATKQISQRFRLAEDYGYKASVAKAYEGYRREAVDIDAGFVAELFGIALDRLKEAPIRLVEGETHGSPWHELLKHPHVIEAANKVPDFAARVSAQATEALRGMRRGGSNGAKPSSGLDTTG